MCRAGGPPGQVWEALRPKFDTLALQLNLLVCSS